MDGIVLGEVDPMNQSNNEKDHQLLRRSMGGWKGIYVRILY
jgi:hypothetical protein